MLLFLPSPKPFHAWRSFILKIFGAKLGRSVHIYPGVKIWAPWLLEVGDHVGIASGVNIYNMAHVKIGSHSVLSQGSHICAGSHDIDTDNLQLVTSPIYIGQNVWVCADAFLGPGVQLADGSVVGARAVVMRSIIEPWSVWAGNPAIKRRNRRKPKQGGLN
jgi:putative colanic acid biosynthesis acetyltransferase WcaF